jgi:hypothetical protein
LTCLTDKVGHTLVILSCFSQIHDRNEGIFLQMNYEPDGWVILFKQRWVNLAERYSVETDIAYQVIFGTSPIGVIRENFF